MLLGPEFRWVLNGYTPNTIPMGRLAEYIQQLAKLMGNEAAVHFLRVEESSVAVVSKTDRPADAGKVEARIAAVRRGEGVADAARAFQNINDMLSEDRKNAFLRRGSAIIMRFPGSQNKPEEALEIKDFGSVTGYLYMLSQLQDGFHARLILDSKNSIQCSCTSDAARELKGHLFETVRVQGSGRWRRTADGSWRAVSLRIERGQRVQSSSFRDLVNELRGVEADWPNDPLGYLADLNASGGAVQ